MNVLILATIRGLCFGPWVDVVTVLVATLVIASCLANDRAPQRFRFSNSVELAALALASMALIPFLVTGRGDGCGQLTSAALLLGVAYALALNALAKASSRSFWFAGIVWLLVGGAISFVVMGFVSRWDDFSPNPRVWVSVAMVVIWIVLPWTYWRVVRYRSRSKVEEGATPD